MPSDASSLAYLAYALFGTGGLWLATRVIREKVVTSPGIRSVLAMVPLFAPLAILIWVRPEFSILTPKTEGIVEMLARYAGLAFSPFASLNPWMLMSFIRLEMRIFALAAQLSGILLVVGAGAATILVVFSRFLGGWFVQKTRETIPIGRGEIPELDRMIMKLSRKAGIPVPGMLLIEDLRAQAFTTGSGRSASLAFSTGLLMAADSEELEAVIAHEIAHMKGRDSHLKLLLSWLRIASFYNPFAHLAARDAIREREFAADLGAIELVGQRESLVRGLELAWRGRISPAGGIVASFSSLVSASPFASHHPSPEERICKARSGPGQRQGKAKRAAWAAAAIFLLLSSALMPGAVARSLQRETAMHAPMERNHHPPLMLGDPTFINRFEEPLPPNRNWRPPEPLIPGDVPSPRQNAPSRGTPADPHHEPGGHLSMPLGVFDGGRPETFPGPQGLLRAVALATMLIHNIYLF